MNVVKPLFVIVFLSKSLAEPSNYHHNHRADRMNNYFNSDEVFWNNIEWDSNPRLQNHNSKVNIIEATDRIDIKEPDEFVQRTNVEAEILGNIDLVNLDSLSPQPSILSTITHGLTTIHSGEDSKRKVDGKLVKRANKDW